MAGSSGMEGEKAAGTAAVPETPAGLRPGVGNRIVRVTDTGAASGLDASDGISKKASGAGAEDSAACAA
jgi:hypothetical protein